MIALAAALTVALVFLGEWSAGLPLAWAEDAQDAAVSETVVIDPGHGGDDDGLEFSGAGLSEKVFTLKVAQALKDRLAQNAGWNVWLTRSRDTSLGLLARQAVAGSKNADVYLSVHATESSSKNTIYLFTHRAVRDENLAKAVRRAQSQHIPAVPWEMAQAEAQAQSRLLAKRIAKAWEAVRWDRGEAFSSVLQEIPAAGITGVRAPAVLVEIPLPESVTAKTADAFCRRAAEALAEGLTDFMSRR